MIELVVEAQRDGVFIGDGGVDRGVSDRNTSGGLGIEVMVVFAAVPERESARLCLALNREEFSNAERLSTSNVISRETATVSRNNAIQSIFFMTCLIDSYDLRN